MQLAAIRAEIEHMRRQVERQRKDIQSLQLAGISTGSAEELLAKMLTKVDELAAQRDRLVGDLRRKYDGKDKFILGRQTHIGKRQG